MKLNIEDYLYQIDQAFEEKEEKEVYMLFALIAGGLVFLSYYFLWDGAKKGYDTALNQSKMLEKKIADDQRYLNSHPESMITAIENQTKAIEAQFLEYQESNEYIKHQIEQISELYYDEKTWGHYIDSISENAKKYNIKIEFYSNTFAENKEAFGHVLDINVKGYGSYHNLMRYINSLEQSFLVVDIHDFDLIAENRLNADLKISVWGITY
jgi:hypothetical protein